VDYQLKQPLIKREHLLIQIIKCQFNTKNDNGQKNQKNNELIMEAIPKVINITKEALSLKRDDHLGNLRLT